MFVLFKLLRTVITAFCLILFLVAGAHAQKWVKLAPFPEPGEEIYGIAAGGKLYVFGGLAPGWKSKGLVYEYDPATDQWTKKKPMALASHHVALAELNGKIYVVGGFVLPKSGPPAWEPINNAWEYDPGADSWKALAPMPTRRGSPNAAAVNGKVYVIGGASTHPGSKETVVHPTRPHRSVDVNEVYDPVTNTWATRSPMPTARNHAAVGVVNNKIYIIGGRIGAAFMLVPAATVDIVEEYDPATDQWGGLKQSMPTPRSAMTWGTYKGRIFVAGGEMRNAQSYGAYRAVEGYDPVANSWSILPPMLVPRHGLAGGVIGNRLHLVSGDVQSLGGLPVPEIQPHTELHDALELPDK